MFFNLEKNLLKIYTIKTDNNVNNVSKKQKYLINILKLIYNFRRNNRMFCKYRINFSRILNAPVES